MHEQTTRTGAIDVVLATHPHSASTPLTGIYTHTRRRRRYKTTAVFREPPTALPPTRAYISKSLTGGRTTSTRTGERGRGSPRRTRGALCVRRKNTASHSRTASSARTHVADDGRRVVASRVPLEFIIECQAFCLVSPVSSIGCRCARRLVVVVSFRVLLFDL